MHFSRCVLLLSGHTSYSPDKIFQPCPSKTTCDFDLRVGPLFVYDISQMVLIICVKYKVESMDSMKVTAWTKNCPGYPCDLDLGSRSLSCIHDTFPHGAHH